MAMRNTSRKGAAGYDLLSSLEGMPFFNLRRVTCISCVYLLHIHCG